MTLFHCGREVQQQLLKKSKNLLKKSNLLINFADFQQNFAEFAFLLNARKNFSNELEF
jgi:hypothetical protein